MTYQQSGSTFFFHIYLHKDKSNNKSHTHASCAKYELMWYYYDKSLRNNLIFFLSEEVIYRVLHITYRLKIIIFWKLNFLTFWTKRKSIVQSSQAVSSITIKYFLLEIVFSYYTSVIAITEYYSLFVMLLPLNENNVRRHHHYTLFFFSVDVTVVLFTRLIMTKQKKNEYLYMHQ